jgi:hypothetical protein
MGNGQILINMIVWVGNIIFKYYWPYFRDGEIENYIDVVQYNALFEIVAYWKTKQIKCPQSH